MVHHGLILNKKPRNKPRNNELDLYPKLFGRERSIEI